MNNKIGELEDNLTKAQKEFGKAQDACSKLQRDLRENVAQKEDQEERIATLEKRYLHAQRESTSLHDLNEKLDQELRHKGAQLQLQEEKIAAIQEKLELTEQKLTQYSKLPEMEEQLKARMEALNQVGSQVSATCQPKKKMFQTSSHLECSTFLLSFVRIVTSDVIVYLVYYSNCFIHTRECFFVHQFFFAWKQIDGI